MKVSKASGKYLQYAIAIILLAGIASAQGSAADYERAQRFLPGNLRHLVYLAGALSLHGRDSSRNLRYFCRRLRCDSRHVDVS